MRKINVSDRVWVAVVFAVAVVHVCLVLRSFPIRVLLEREIPLKGDVSRYFATAHGASQVKGLFGYDPYFMAGYPVGLWNSMGKKGFEILHLLFPWIPLLALFYLVLVGVSIFAPLAVWAALKRFCHDKTTSRVLFFILLLYWHLSTQISYFWGFGNVFFPAMSCLAPVICGLAWDVFSSRRIMLSAALLGLVAAVVFYCHTVVLVAVIVPLGLIVVLNYRKLTASRETRLAIGVACVVFGLLCVWWLVPLLKNAGDCVPQPEQWLQSTWKHLIMDVFSDRVYQHHFDRNFLLHAAVVLGTAGIFLSWRRNRIISVLGIGGMACLVVTYTVSYLGPAAAIQPYRFLIPATILFMGPMATGVIWAFETPWNAGRQVKIAVILLLLIVLPALTGYIIDSAWRKPKCGLNDAHRDVLDAISDLPVQGRLLCDDAGLGHIIPFFRKSPVIGGLSAQAFLKHRFAGFDGEGRLFGRKPGEWKWEYFKRYLDAYAVDYAILARKDWIEFAEQGNSLFELEARVGFYRIYRVRDAKPSMVLCGKARAHASYDVIEVRDIDSDVILLKLHYSGWLKASDGVRLVPEYVLEDPVPFIRCIVPENVTAFRISKGY